MQNEDLIREVAIKACREALQERSQALAEDVARRLAAALAAQPPRERTKDLRDGAVLIAGSRTQTETLEALLAASSALTPACGLLILRGAQASGWSCRGFASPENFKWVSLDCSRGVAATVIRSCVGVLTQATELDPVFTAKLGLNNSAQMLLVPVLLNQRVAALLIARSLQGDDLAGLELLVQVTQLALDAQAARKASPQPAVAPQQPAEPHYPAAELPRPTTTSLSPAPVSASGVTGASTHPVLDEAHEKARRFAKLLVEEIKLYNQTKVAEGRTRCDLYSRLREDIEKSRAAYQKRYGERVQDVDYFSEELMRILADNNRTVMGAGFPG